MPSAADYGVADVTTAATYHIAARLSRLRQGADDLAAAEEAEKVELEQYNVMLEEQAFPFEEKATELHEVNATPRRRAASTTSGCRSSFDALRELRPVRYGKVERSEGVVDAIR